VISFIARHIQATPRIILVIYTLVLLYILLSVTSSAERYWHQKYHSQAIFGCIDHITHSPDNKLHAIYVIDKYNHKIKLTSEDLEKSKQLEQHLYYCYKFDVYLHTPLGADRSIAYISNVQGLDKKPEESMHLADFISRQILQNPTAGGTPER
jgi:hypothetical protein